jgi:aminopeptidase N
VPIAEITRTETAERSRLLQVDDYDVALDLTRGGEVFGSVSVIRFRCAEPGASTYVDLIAADVHEVVLNGVPVDPAGAVKGGGGGGAGGGSRSAGWPRTTNCGSSRTAVTRPTGRA